LLVVVAEIGGDGLEMELEFGAGAPQIVASRPRCFCDHRVRDMRRIKIPRALFLGANFKIQVRSESLEVLDIAP
jgi:hypothetical protein